MAGMARKITSLVIHCSASPNGRVTTCADINAWHRARGFRRAPSARQRFSPQLDAIGYHWVIYTDGTVAAGRGPDEMGAHAMGHNATSLGICLVGTDRYTRQQWLHLASHVRALCLQYAIPLKPAAPGATVLTGVIGHGEIAGVRKTCPGFSVASWIERGLPPMPDHILEK